MTGQASRASRATVSLGHYDWPTLCLEESLLLPPGQAPAKEPSNVNLLPNPDDRICCLYGDMILSNDPTKINCVVVWLFPNLLSTPLGKTPDEQMLELGNAPGMQFRAAQT
jgi:hypothetical protein